LLYDELDPAVRIFQFKGQPRIKTSLKAKQVQKTIIKKGTCKKLKKTSSKLFKNTTAIELKQQSEKRKYLRERTAALLMFKKTFEKNLKKELHQENYKFLKQTATEEILKIEGKIF
jgi:hypothetical protein